MGGEAIPVLEPAIKMPAASTGAEDATATVAIPRVATIPASTATRRGPHRGVRIKLPTIAAQ